MGNQSSKDHVLSDSLNRFSNEEKDDIQKLFTAISKEKAFTCKKFTDHFGRDVTETFAEQLCRASASSQGKNSNGLVDQGCFIKTLAILLKGDQEEVGNYLLSMMGHNATCTNQELKQFLRDIIQQYIVVVEKNSEYKSWNFNHSDETTQRLVQMLYFNLFHKRKSVSELWQSSQVTFSEDELAASFCSESLLSKVLRFISCNLFPVLQNEYQSLLPRCTVSCSKESSALLDLPSVLMLNQSIPAQINSTWRLLYSTSIHGQSFSMLLGKLVQKGPSLIVIKDKEGHMFGGFTSQSWELKPTFSGKEDAFVFTMSPTLAVYSSSGYNSNYTYLCLHQHTLPNGLGFGGQLNNFGLWLDCEFEIGHSTPACSTYCSPQLSGSRQYKLDELQAWGIGPCTTELKEEEKPKKSILDSDVGAKAIMTMMNKVGASDAIREEDQQLEKEAAREKSS